MAKLNSPRRLIVEDYPPKYNDLVSGFFYIINQFIESVSFAFNKNLNFNDNFQALDVTISVIGNGAGTTVRNTLPSPITGAQVLRVDSLTNPNEILETSPFVQFTNGQGQLIINNITGLTEGNQYRLRIVFFA
jgi:hypothetical protein